MAGYYEWSANAEDGKKDPWFIHAASPLLADIHDRMPAWLTAGQADEWMAAETDDAMAMLLASEPPAMDAYRVSRAVNTPRNNSPRLLQPA